MKEVSFNDIIGKNGVFIDGDWIESKDQDPTGEVRLIQLADIGDGYFINKSNRYLTKETAIRLKCTFLKKGDILIARMPDPLGRACIFPGLEKECVTVVDVCIIRSDQSIVSNDWLKFLINSIDYRNTINQFITGTTRQRISRGNLSKLKFKLPSLSDQIHIAEILSQAEALIAARKESIRLLDELLKSTFLEMFGTEKHSKKEGTIKTIGEICKFKGGGTPSKSKPEYFTGNIPWVSPKDMKSLYIISSQDKITPKAIEESSTSLIPKGAVLMVVRSGILKSKLPVAINKVDVTINQDMKAFVSSEVQPVYLLYFFISNERNILKKVRATTADNFDFDDIKNLKIVVPSLNLQKQFASIVEKVEFIKNQSQKSLQELQNMYAVLSQKAFKGELSTNDSAISVLVSEEPEEAYFEKRKTLASYIINQSLEDEKFGDVKFQKLLHLSDYHILKRNLNQKYYQKAAGPFDNNFTIPFIEEVKKNKWFIHEKTESQSIFKPGTKHRESLNTNGYLSQSELNGINNLIHHFKNCDYEDPEIISTLYAVWNNRIIKKQPISDELLKEDFLNWDNQKVKYKKFLDKGLKWMREHNIIPDGWGKVIEKPKNN